MFRTANRAWSFKIDRHDVRSTLPAAIRGIMQNGLLWKAYEDALLPEFLYPALGDSRPWGGSLGDTTTFTRTGLLAPQVSPLNGADPTASTYGVEQYSATMNQYGNSVDTNMVSSAMALASKFLRDGQTLATNAGQSINQLCRNKLYAAYAGGRTWTAATSTSSTTLLVTDGSGLANFMVNGVLTPVSGGNALAITVAGVANTITGVTYTGTAAQIASQTGPATLTLGTAISSAIGDPVVSNVAPVSYRPNARATAFNLTAGDVASMALFRSAVARLRTMNVPTLDGNYVAHIDPTTEAELFADSDFKQAYQGRGDSAVFGNLSLGVFGGIDWVRNNEAPTLTVGSNTVHRPMVLGADSLIAAPFDNTAQLLADTGVGDVPSIKLIGPAQGLQVAFIVRPPQDRLQQTVSSTWSYIGDFCVPSDATTGGQSGADPALYKRGVLIEHL